MKDFSMYSAIENDSLKQFIDELKFALKKLTDEDLKKVFIEASKIAARTTYNAKKKSIINVADFAKRTYKRYNENGFLKSVYDDGVSAKEFISSLPEKVTTTYDLFIKQPREKQIEVIIVAILTLSIFYLSAGGADFEGGLPDTDIALAGIDAHRSVFTHSILLGLSLEFTGRFCLLLLKKIQQSLPSNHLPVWDKIFNFLDNHSDKAIAAMWLGIGVHLLKDSGFLTGGVKPYADIPVGMPMDAHQGLFAANGIASTIFSRNVK